MKTLSQYPKVNYSVTRLGGGQTAQGVAFPGGLDLTTPRLTLQTGALVAALNFECSQSGGYARIGGYDRYDGRAAPSAAAYTVVQFSAFTNVPALNDVLTQATSAATGKVIAVNNGTAGLYYVALTQVSGTFDITHLVSHGATAIGIPITTTVSLDAQTQAQYLAAAGAVYRALIQPVPGSGSILGVVHMVFSGADNIYAFRANIGATAVNLYKSTGTGWTQVNYYNVVNFTAGGTATPLDGDTLTQGGVTATIKRVMTRSGAWTGTAVGGFVITNPAGGNFAAGAATTSSGATITLSAIQTAITFTPGGKFEFTKANFSGAGSSRRIYGCDGVNKAFEFDGDTLAPITTGNNPDTPSHITNHKNYLVVSQGSSLVGSAAGLPFKWTAIDGAWEIATGDTVTAMMTLPGSQSTATLAVFQRINTSFLYGLDPTTFNFVTFNTNSGALAYSAQNLSDVFVFDILGVLTLQTTLNWGNFLPSSLSKNILPFIVQERTKLTASCINRNKSQYRVFFSDGYGLYVTMLNRQYLGSVPVQFPNPVNVIDEDVDASGNEVTYFGSNDGLGYVYQLLESGTSFDGADLNAYITPNWDAIKSPRVKKRFRSASIEMQGGSYAQISFGYQLGYGSTNYGQPGNVNANLGFTAAPNWDSFQWDNFTWDGSSVMPTDLDLQGSAENIQPSISSGTNYIAPYTIDSLIYHYSMRRGLRV